MSLKSPNILSKLLKKKWKKPKEKLLESKAEKKAFTKTVHTSEKKQVEDKRTAPKEPVTEENKNDNLDLNQNCFEVQSRRPDATAITCTPGRSHVPPGDHILPRA